MGINWWAVLAILEAVFLVAIFVVTVVAVRAENKQKGQKTAEARLPEIGDEYLILDHVWRVRSREAVSKGSEERVAYTIYIEHLPSGTMYEGSTHKRATPEWLGKFKFLGNPKKSAATVEQQLKEMAIKHGVSTQEVRLALDSDTGDVDMTKCPVPDEPIGTFTGHAATDRMNHPENMHGDPAPLDPLKLPGLTDEGRKRIAESRGLPVPPVRKPTIIERFGAEGDENTDEDETVEPDDDTRSI